MMLVLLSYLFYFAAASASPLQRRWLSTNKEGGGQIQFAFRVMLFVAICGFLLPLFSQPQLNGGFWQIVLLGLITGLSGALFFIGNYSAQKHVDAGVTSLISNIYTPVTIIIASLFLSESLKPMQLVGTLILLFAMVLVSKKHRVGRFNFDKYFWLMILSGVSLGICLSAERALMKTTGFSAGTLISWWSQVLALGLATLIFKKNRTSYGLKDTLITGSLRFLQALSWVVLLQVVGNLSIVSAVTTFKVVVIFLFAAILLKEREDLPRKIVGSLIAIFGLLLIK